MKNGVLIVAAIAILWFATSSTANAAAPVSSLALSGMLQSLSANFVLSLDQANTITSLYNAMVSNGLNSQQIAYCMSQLLFESGLLTDIANYGLMQQNNFAGLTTTSGGYAAYNSIGDFMTVYIGFLTKGSNPLGATSLTDFNNRLQANGYYTEDPTVYYNGLLSYYNILTQ